MTRAAQSSLSVAILGSESSFAAPFRVFVHHRREGQSPSTLDMCRPLGDFRGVAVSVEVPARVVRPLRRTHGFWLWVNLFLGSLIASVLCLYLYVDSGETLVFLIAPIAGIRMTSARAGG